MIKLYQLYISSLILQMAHHRLRTHVLSDQKVIAMMANGEIVHLEHPLSPLYVRIPSALYSLSPSLYFYLQTVSLESVFSDQIHTCCNIDRILEYCHQSTLPEQLQSSKPNISIRSILCIHLLPSLL